jgi:hypothetical protein
MADRRKKENLKTELLDADFKDLMDTETANHSSTLTIWQDLQDYKDI